MSRDQIFALKKDFAERLLRIGIEIEQAKEIVLMAEGELKAKAPEKRPLRALEDQWYTSLRNGAPDYSVYRSPYYLAEVFACFLTYPRKYLSEIQKPDSLYYRSITDYLKKIDSVLDLGCGLGYTTRELKKIFPKTRVCGFDFEGSYQYRFCSTLATENSFELLKKPEKVGSNTLIFASEYFEHILHPLEHLVEILKIARPRHLLVANAFGQRAIGHFLSYTHEGRKVSVEDIARNFSPFLRHFGYSKVPTRLWNSRPTLYSLDKQI
jgi:SAM-dependent methyltransferase